MLGVVLVHGINSSPDMWAELSGLMEGDGELTGVAAEVQPRFGYSTGLFRRRLTRAIPTLDTVADSLKEYLRTEAAPGRFERLVLVGHSMGGLVIQRYLARMLAEGRGPELARIRRVVLLATPNTGSLLLRDARRVLLRSNPQERQLRPLNAQVADTLRIVLRDVVNAPAEPTERTCRIAFSVYAGETDAVVPPGSAQAGFPEALALPGHHFTIARPHSREHRTYSTLKRLLLEATDGDPPPQSVTTLGPVVLEVHNAVAGGKRTGAGAGVTAYLQRQHDRELREVLAEVLAGGASRLIMLTGGSSTGKTRALYEALIALAPHAPLLHPIGKPMLAELLGSGRVTPGCVLWLNEAQRFLYGNDGEQAACLLRAVLESTKGIAVLGTLWTDPYWNELTAAGRGNPHAQGRALLIHPGSVRLHVPDHLSAHDLDAWRNLADANDDPRLDQALAAGAAGGRVIQHLSGGPELLQAYLAGPDRLFTPREHALLSAALDARRLGHMGPLLAELLAAAADGDLPPRDRAPDTEWARGDLDALATGRRPDGSRTDIRATLTALTAVRARAGAEPGYEPADYLDQHTRGPRADRRGTGALWQALLEHTADSSDQDRLARAAWKRGLRTTAARLWYKAVTAGHPTTSLAQLGSDLDPAHEAATYSAAHADLTDPDAVAQLLRALQKAGAEQAVATLLQRDPVAHVNLTKPWAVLALLKVLRAVGADQAVVHLAERAAADTDLTDTAEVARLLWELRAVGAEHAVVTLLERNPAALADPTDTGAVIEMLRTLHALGPPGAKQGVATLLERNPAGHVNLANTHAVYRLLRELREVGAEQDVATLLQRNPAAHVDLTDTNAMSWLLKELRDIGATDAVSTLMGRNPAARVNLTDTDAVVRLLKHLRDMGAEEAIATLLGRNPAAYVNLTKPWAVLALLKVLREVGDEPAVATLLERNPSIHAEDFDDVAESCLRRELVEASAEPGVVTLLGNSAAHVNLTDANAVARLLGVLWWARAEQAVATLLERSPAVHVSLADTTGVAMLLWVLRAVGAEQAAVDLLERAAAHADPTDTAGVAQLLQELPKTGTEQAMVTSLGLRAATEADLTDPDAVAHLLHALHVTGAEQAVVSLLQRNPAAHANLSDDLGSFNLLWGLREIGAEQATASLLARQLDAGHDPDHYAPHGREPDGSPSPPWTWHDLTQI